MGDETLPEWPFKGNLLEHGEVDGITWALAAAPRDPAVNGYIYLPEGHPWRDEKEPMFNLPVEVHGGITYAQHNWLGFDMMHAWDWWTGWEGQQYFTRYDDMEVRTIDDVRAEAQNLARQAAAAINNGTHEI
jgi:hypothetical protein